MWLAVQLSDDQMAIIGCAIVFGGCLAVMMISQKIGDNLRGRHSRPESDVVPFPASRQDSNRDRRAA